MQTKQDEAKLTSPQTSGGRGDMRDDELREPDRLLNVEEVAEMMGVAPQTIYNWVYARRIPHLKPSRSILRFDRSEVRKWLADHAVPAKGEGNDEE